MIKCPYCGIETENQYCSKQCEENSIAFDILEDITEELDIVFKATEYPWKVYLTNASYDALKNRPGTKWDVHTRSYLPYTYIYEKDGFEYLKCWENHNIPFIVHARIVDTNAIKNNLTLDDLNNPNIKKDYMDDFNRFQLLEGIK